MAHLLSMAPDGLWNRVLAVSFLFMGHFLLRERTRFDEEHCHDSGHTLLNFYPEQL